MTDQEDETTRVERDRQTVTIYEGPLSYYFRAAGIEEGTHIADHMTNPITDVIMPFSGGDQGVSATEGHPPAGGYIGVQTADSIATISEADLASLFDWTPDGEEPLTQTEKERATNLLVNAFNGIRWAIQSEGKALPTDIAIAIVKYAPTEGTPSAALYDVNNKRVSFDRENIVNAVRNSGDNDHVISITNSDPRLVEYHAQPHEFHALEKRLEDAIDEASTTPALQAQVEHLENLISMVKARQESNT